MYTFELTDQYLSKEETAIFDGYLEYHGLDAIIWDVFAALFNSAGKNTKPFLLKAFKDGALYGVIVLVKCSKYGRALFGRGMLAAMANLTSVPFYLWIKFGCCMDMMSNPGFVKDPDKSSEVFKAMLGYLKRNSLLVIVNDYDENKSLHPSASVLPALPHALIDCSAMTAIDDYTTQHKNIKRKIRVFKNKHGAYKRVEGQLSDEDLKSMKRCFLSTADKSVFYLPYQELYLKAALTTSSTKLREVHYFIATIDNEFIGYQAALVTGEYLNALHGAFDRDRTTTYHAYDILFVKMTEFALERGLKIIDFGAVINYTKEKMVNKSKEMSYFIYSKYSLLQKAIHFLLKQTKIQGTEQMKFRKSM